MSQPAIALVSTEEVPGDPDLVQATLVLRCGCRITLTIASDRILDRDDGERVAVGKYRCPMGHPV